MQFGKQRLAPYLVLIATLLLPLLWQTSVSAHSQLRQPGQLYYLDIGNSTADPFISNGFGPNMSRDFNFCTLDGDDGSYRYQKMGQNNIINLPVLAHQDIHLEMCVEHGVAQDTWTLYVNGHKLLHNSNEQSGLPIVYRLDVPAKYVTKDSLRLNFHSTSTDRDGAAVFGILYWQ